jgi:hypothetical protein
MSTPAAIATTPARVLREAAVYLTRRGWVQGCYYDQTATVFDPAACTVGAIGMVCYGGPVDAPALNHTDPGFAAFEAAVAYLDGWLIEHYGQDVYSFNDTPGRAVCDVVVSMRSAAFEWDHTHLRCPECGDPAIGVPPRHWGMPEFLPVPEFSHVDGTPLCPVYEPDGTRPCEPVLTDGGAV